MVVVCGMQQLTCPITVVYKEVTETEPIMTHAPETVPETTAETEPEAKAAETEAPETEAPETEAPETEAPETEPEETKKPIDPSIELKLKKTDLLFKGLGLSTHLELDCDLEPEDVYWWSSNSDVILVDKSGKVTTRNYGAATITAKYGEQEVKCVVRCAKS